MRGARLLREKPHRRSEINKRSIAPHSPGPAALSAWKATPAPPAHPSLLDCVNVLLSSPLTRFLKLIPFSKVIAPEGMKVCVWVQMTEEDGRENAADRTEERQQRREERTTRERRWGETRVMKPRKNGGQR